MGLQKNEKALLTLLCLFGIFAIFSFVVNIWLHLKGPPLDRDLTETLMTESSPGQFIPNTLTNNTYISYFNWDRLPNVKFHSIVGTITKAMSDTYPSIQSAEVVFTAPPGRCAYVKRTFVSTSVFQPSSILGVLSPEGCAAFAIATNLSILPGAPLAVPMFVRGPVMNPGEKLAYWVDPGLSYHIDIVTWDHVPGAPEGFRLWNVTQQASYSPPKGYEMIPYPRWFDRMILSYTQPVAGPTDINVEIDGLPVWSSISINTGWPTYHPRMLGFRLPILLKDDQTLTLDVVPSPLTSMNTLEWNGMLRPKTEESK